MRFQIGFAAPLTGPQSIVGVPMRGVVEMAVAEAVRQGCDVGVTAVDDEADEEVAVRVAERLAADDSVIAVVGHKNSGPSRAAAPVYSRAGLAQLAQCATDNSLTRSGWKTFFRLCADNERQAGFAAEFVRARIGPRRPVAVHDGTDYGRPLVEAFAARLGIPGPDVMSMRVGQEDFAELVAAIVERAADLVYMGATEVEGSKLTIALHDAHAGAQVVTSEGGPHNPFPRLAGPAAEGSIHTYAGVDPSASPAARQLAARCIRELGDAPSFMVECYDAVTAIVAALASGAADRAQVRDAIARNHVDGLVGTIGFDAAGERIDAPVSLWRVEGGRMVPLAANARV